MKYVNIRDIIALNAILLSIYKPPDSNIASKKYLNRKNINKAIAETIPKIFTKYIKKLFIITEGL
jgi:hypothetical protein